MLLLAFVIENKSVHFKPSPDTDCVCVFQIACKGFYFAFGFPCCEEGSKGNMWSIGPLWVSPIFKYNLLFSLLSGKLPMCILTVDAVVHHTHSSCEFSAYLRCFAFPLVPRICALCSVWVTCVLKHLVIRSCKHLHVGILLCRLLCSTGLASSFVWQCAPLALPTELHSLGHGKCLYTYFPPGEDAVWGNCIVGRGQCENIY